MADSQAVKRQVEALTEGCVDVIQLEELTKRVAGSLDSGRPLVVKAGFDPSSPDIHLGHVVLLRKMKQFQDLGHQVVFVVGDFTAMIGDPTGRSKTRPQLSREQIVENAQTYRRQAAKVLDDAKASFSYNSEWLDALGSVGLIRLAARHNVARMLERRDFRQRFDSGQSIAVHEFLYPLVQAYDSVHLKADVELGGTDQLFNLNVGRDIMPEYGLAPQVVMTTPLLEGLDGVEKMSKSLDNAVAIEDPPNEMFGKLMSVSDDLMWKYWRLLGGVPAYWVEIAKAAVEAGVVESNGRLGEQWPRLVEALGWKADRLRAVVDDLGASTTAGKGTGPLSKESLALARIRNDLGARSLHPKEIKIALARRIVTDFHGAEAARRAGEEFQQVFAQHENPSEIEERVLPLASEDAWLPKLIAELGLSKSNGEAIRLIQQGGVTVDGRRIDSKEHRLPASRPASYLLKVGKRRFVRVRFE